MAKRREQRTKKNFGRRGSELILQLHIPHFPHPFGKLFLLSNLKTCQTYFTPFSFWLSESKDENVYFFSVKVHRYCVIPFLEHFFLEKKINDFSNENSKEMYL